MAFVVAAGARLWRLNLDRYAKTAAEKVLRLRKKGRLKVKPSF
jgi:hypothetical protein